MLQVHLVTPVCVCVCYRKGSLSGILKTWSKAEIMETLDNKAALCQPAQPPLLEEILSSVQLLELFKHDHFQVLYRHQHTSVFCVCLLLESVFAQFRNTNMAPDQWTVDG